MVSKDKQATRNRKYEGLEILQRRIPSSSDIVRREETEYVLSRFWELPKLRCVYISTWTLRSDAVEAGLQMPSMDRQQG